MRMSDDGARYLPHPMVSAIFIIALVILFLTGPSLFAQPDVAWHIATGNLIRETHEVPKTDPWSYASNGAPWYNGAWGWGVILSVIVQVFGERGLFNISYLFAAVILAVLCHALISRKTIHEGAIILSIVIIGLIHIGFSPARPQTMSHLLILCYAMVLHRSRTSQTYGTLLALPCIMLLWVNTHGGFVVGFTILGAYGLEACVTRQWLWLRRLLVVSIACAAVIFVNPDGWRVITTVLISTGSIMNGYLLEWAPFMYGRYPARTIFLLVFILVTASLNKTIPLADKILSFAWLVLALQADRHFPVFALLAAPYVAMNMTSFMKLRRLPDLLGVKYRVGMLSCAMLTTVLLFLPPVQKQLAINEYSFVFPGLVPLDAIHYIQKNYPGKRFYNDYNMGGILIYYLGDTNQIFVDGRAQSAYPEEVMREAVSFLNMDENWYKALDKYQVDGLILYNYNAFYKLYSQGMFHDQWDLAFHGTLASVYIRKQ